MFVINANEHINTMLNGVHSHIGLNQKDEWLNVLAGVWRELMKIPKLLEILLKVKNPDIKVLYLIAQCHYRIREERSMLIKSGIKEGMLIKGS